MKYHAIAIDGPAGAGKSTIARLVASRLNAVYVDTGAMYRAMTIYMLRNNIDILNEKDVLKASENVEISIAYENGQQQVFLNGENVTSLLREEKVGAATSTVSGYKFIREKLVDLQRKLSKTCDIVMDGRDIGTVVLPFAALKIYLDASVEVRAARRYKELSQKGISGDIDIIKRDIEVRDVQDMTRKESPLKKADDAVEIDSSSLTINEVAEKIISLYEERI